MTVPTCSVNCTEFTAQKGSRGKRTSEQARTWDLRMLYRGVSAMQATDPSRDPSSPIALMSAISF